MAQWLVGCGVRSAAAASNLFTDAELENGEALMTVAEGLGITEAQEFEEAENQLMSIVQSARRDDKQRTLQFNKRKTYEIVAEQIAQKRKTASQDQEAQRKRSREQEASGPKEVRVPSFPRYPSRLGRAVALENPRARENAEDKEKEKWVAELIYQLNDCKYPMLIENQKCQDPERLLRVQMGTRRAGTLRARVREWRKFRVWLRARRRGSAVNQGKENQAIKLEELVDFLLARHDECPTKSTVARVTATLKFYESIGGVKFRLTEETSFVNVSKGLHVQAASRKDGQSRQQATPPTVEMLKHLEGVVVDTEACLNDRLIAWWCLVASWAVLRFDDHRGLNPASIQELDSGWSLLLNRTKTTGHDKNVELRCATISAEAYIVHPLWLSAGKNLWAKRAPMKRDFFLCSLVGLMPTRELKCPMSSSVLTCGM